MGNSAQRRAVKNYLIRAYYEWVVWVVGAFKGRGEVGRWRQVAQVLVCLVGPAGSPACHATEPPSRSETVLASSMPLWAPASPIYTQTHPVLGVGLACLRFAQLDRGSMRTMDGRTCRKNPRVCKPPQKSIMYSASEKTIMGVLCT